MKAYLYTSLPSAREAISSEYTAVLDTIYINFKTNADSQRFLAFGSIISDCVPSDQVMQLGIIICVCTSKAKMSFEDQIQT